MEIGIQTSVDGTRPTTGQAATVQGEVIRAVGRLSDEAYRNGNINFGKNHRMLCKFIRLNLEDPAVFSSEEIAEIDQCIDEVLDAKHPGSARVGILPLPPRGEGSKVVRVEARL